MFFASATHTSFVHTCKHLICSIYAQTVANLLFEPTHLEFAVAVASFVPFVANCTSVSFVYKAKHMCVSMVGV